MSEIYWVFGCSGSGKARFINYMTGKPSSAVLKRLGWNDKKIVKIQESLDFLAQYVGKGVNKKRKNMIARIKEEVKNPDRVILIKGQLIDLEQKLPQDLYKGLPKTKHYIIYLFSGLETSFKRCYNKTWWDKNWDVKKDIGGFRNYAKLEVELLKILKDFKIISLNSKGNSYKKVKFPPNLD